MCVCTRVLFAAGCIATSLLPRAGNREDENPKPIYGAGWDKAEPVLLKSNKGHFQRMETKKASDNSGSRSFERKDHIPVQLPDLDQIIHIKAAIHWFSDSLHKTFAKSRLVNYCA